MISIPISLTLPKTNTTQPTQTTQPNQSTQPYEKPKERRYWPVPTMMPSVFEYQDVNKDLRLRKDVTQFFHRKVIKWIDTEDSCKHLKQQKTFLESVDGQMHIYQTLRKFVKKSGINWYDLRDNYPLIKQYLCHKL
jgi:hypothetical protein